MNEQELDDFLEHQRQAVDKLVKDRNELKAEWSKYRRNRRLTQAIRFQQQEIENKNSEICNNILSVQISAIREILRFYHGKVIPLHTIKKAREDA